MAPAIEGLKQEAPWGLLAHLAKPGSPRKVREPISRVRCRVIEKDECQPLLPRDCAHVCTCPYIHTMQTQAHTDTYIHTHKKSSGRN